MTSEIKMMYSNFIETLLKECDAFLEAEPTETIILSLKIDDNHLDTDAQRKTADSAFKIGVQDHYNFGMQVKGCNALKTDNFYDAMDLLRDGHYNVLWNFASAYTCLLFPIYPQEEMKKRVSSLRLEERPQKMGWVLMDYEDALYKTDMYGNVSFVSFIIDSNLLEGKRYSTYSDSFQLI